jgi:hypothetical protein
VAERNGISREKTDAQSPELPGRHRRNVCMAGFPRFRADLGDLPILFAHGNGDQAPIWPTTLWRFESNG